MAACHRLTSQICAHSKALSCWFTMTSFLKIIYRTVGLHTLSSHSLLSPVICLAVRVGLQNAKYFFLRWGALKPFFSQSPGFRKHTQDTKKTHKRLGWRKRNMTSHLCCQRRDVTRMERPPLCADWCRGTTGPSLSLRPQYLTLQWNCQEHCLGTGRSVWMQTAWQSSFRAVGWKGISW